MRELSILEVQNISGSGPNFLKVVGGTIWGATIGAIIGFGVAGPAGMVVGLVDGAITGGAAAVVKEGAEGLVDITQNH